MTIFEVEAFALDHCPYSASWLTPWMILTRYSSYAITLGLFAAGLYRQELFFLILGLGLTLNGWLNWLYVRVFLSPIPFPPCGSSSVYCTPGVSKLSGGWIPCVPPGDPGAPECVPCGGPSFEVSQNAFFITAIMVYCLQWRAPHFTAGCGLGLSFWLAAVAVSQQFLGFNTWGQVLAAAATGAVQGGGWQLIVFALLYPRFDWMLNWGLIRWQGYKDTLCQSCPPVPGDPPPMGVWVAEKTP